MRRLIPLLLLPVFLCAHAGSLNSIYFKNGCSQYERITTHSQYQSWAQANPTQQVLDEVSAAIPGQTSCQSIEQLSRLMLRISDQLSSQTSTQKLDAIATLIVLYGKSNRAAEMELLIPVWMDLTEKVALPPNPEHGVVYIIVASYFLEKLQPEQAKKIETRFTEAITEPETTLPNELQNELNKLRATIRFRLGETEAGMNYLKKSRSEARNNVTFASAAQQVANYIRFGNIQQAKQMLESKYESQQNDLTTQKNKITSNDQQTAVKFSKIRSIENSLIVTAYDLATYFHSQKEFGKAEAMYLASIDYLKTNQSIRLVFPERALGILYRQTGNFVAAEANLQASLPELLDRYGAYHPMVLETVNELIYVKFKQGNLVAARQILLEQLDVLERSLQTTAAQKSRLWIALGDIAKETQDTNEAKKYYQTALDSLSQSADDIRLNEMAKTKLAVLLKPSVSPDLKGVRKVKKT
jgi:hypothetical protein